MNWFDNLFQWTGAGLESGRVVASLSILVGGLILLEVIFRFARRRIQTALEEKGFAPENWNLSDLLLPLRLAFMALLLRLAKGLLLLSNELNQLLSGVEGILAALAVILIFFYLVNMADRLRFILPQRLQDEFPESGFAKLKNFLRIGVLISVAAVFIYTQKTFFPQWLWEYSWWRYLLILIVWGVVCLTARFVGRTLKRMLLALQDSTENTRLRLVLQSASWPLRLLFGTIAVSAFKEIFVLPATLNRFTDAAISILGALAAVIFLYRLI